MKRIFLEITSYGIEMIGVPYIHHQCVTYILNSLIPNVVDECCRILRWALLSLPPFWKTYVWYQDTLLIYLLTNGLQFASQHPKLKEERRSATVDSWRTLKYEDSGFECRWTPQAKLTKLTKQNAFTPQLWWTLFIVWYRFTSQPVDNTWFVYFIQTVTSFLDRGWCNWRRSLTIRQPNLNKE
jgi:hypothetical protein